MANAAYTYAKSLILTAQLDFSTAPLYVALVDTGVYTFSAAHQFASALAGAVVGTHQALTGLNVTDGVFDADNVTFSAVTGPTIEAVVIYRYTGNLATSPLALYWDSGVTGLPATPNGGDITVAWSNGPSKIFAL